MINSKNLDSQRGAAAPTRRRTTANGTAEAQAAAVATDHAEHVALNLPLIGQVKLPRPEQLAYYAGIGILVSLEVLEWPAALVLGVGHALLTQQHNRTMHEFGAALEDALAG